MYYKQVATYISWTYFRVFSTTGCKAANHRVIESYITQSNCVAQVPKQSVAVRVKMTPRQREMTKRAMTMRAELRAQWQRSRSMSGGRHACGHASQLWRKPTWGIRTGLCEERLREVSNGLSAAVLWLITRNPACLGHVLDVIYSRCSEQSALLPLFAYNCFSAGTGINY